MLQTNNDCYNIKIKKRTTKVLAGNFIKFTGNAE